MTNFGAAEKRRAEEINRQSMVLHERLAKRQVMAQQRAADKREEKEEFQERKKQPNNIIAVLKKREKLMDDQCSRYEFFGCNHSQENVKTKTWQPCWMI
jgi:hypothetical protein